MEQMEQMERLDDVHKAAWRALLVSRARLVKKIDQELTAAGVVSFDWYDVLLWLEENDGRLKMGELADKVLTSWSGLTRMVDRIEAAGYIKRESCATDRRVVFVCLTEAGYAARKAAWAVYEPEIVRHFAQYLSTEEAEIIGTALNRAVEGE